MSSNTIVRPLGAADREIWNGLWQGYLTFYKHNLEDEVSDDVYRRLTSGDPHFVGLGAIAADGTLVGFTHYVVHRSTWTTGYYCYLEDLFVDPAARGGGAARCLIEEVYRRADDAGWSRVYWNTEHHNATARKLYDKLAKLTDLLVYQRD